jgi:hypothetical protein
MSTSLSIKKGHEAHNSKAFKPMCRDNGQQGHDLTVIPAASKNVLDRNCKINKNSGLTISFIHGVGTVKAGYMSEEKHPSIASIDIDGTVDTSKVKPIGIKRFATPDPVAVMKGCEFLKTDVNELLDRNTFKSREMLIAWLSVVLRLPDGYDIANKRLSRSELYDQKWVADMSENATAISGPRLCSNIDKIWGECKNCQWHKAPKITSPIKITSGPGFEQDRRDGFRKVKLDKFGNPQGGGRIKYERLLEYFNSDKPFITIDDSGNVYKYIDKQWQEVYPSTIKAFAQDNIRNPKPSDSHRKEFLNLIKVTNLKERDWFMSSTMGLINLQNGVFDIEKDKLLPHSKDYGFKYILPYEYDPKAECPRFLQFLDEITLGRAAIQEVLMEFAGYALANGPCYAEKALILYGSGANGKSTFMDVLKALAGSDNYSSLSLTALNKDTKRYMVDGKLFNI